MPKPNIENASATLLFRCPDAVGIVSQLGGFFAEHDLTISHFQEMVDDGYSFSRVHWRLDKRWDDETAFTREFEPLAAKFEANFSVHFCNREQSIGLLASRENSALVEVLNKADADFFPNAGVGFVLGNDPVLQQTADRHGVPFFHLEPAGKDNAGMLNYERQKLEIIQRYKPDCLALADYHHVISANLFGKIECPIVALHHSFLTYPGAPEQYSAETDQMDPYQRAYDKGVKLIGATSRLISAELNRGPIIEQDVLAIKSGASLEVFAQQGREIEQRVFSAALLKLLQHKILLHKNRTIVFN